MPSTVEPKFLVDPPALRGLALIAQGRSYRLIGREFGPSQNTVTDVVRRERAAEEAERRGWSKISTYTLVEESGMSLRYARWSRNPHSYGRLHVLLRR